MKLSKDEAGIDLELERLNEAVALTFRACEFDISKKISIIIRPQVHKMQPRFDIILDGNELEAIVRDNVISIIYHPGVDGVLPDIGLDKDRYNRLIRKLLNYISKHCDIPPSVMREAYQVLDECDKDDRKM